MRAGVRRAVALVCVLAGCGDEGPAGQFDPEARLRLGSGVRARTDVGFTPADAGLVVDAAPRADASEPPRPDAGAVLDAGIRDAFALWDSGVHPDAAPPPDSGVHPDAAPPPPD